MTFFSVCLRVLVIVLVIVVRAVLAEAAAKSDVAISEEFDDGRCLKWFLDCGWNLTAVLVFCGKGAGWYMLLIMARPLLELDAADGWRGLLAVVVFVLPSSR